MKNKDSIFKKKGFYVALYSCVGVVMVLAAVISFQNLNAVQKPLDNKTAQAEENVASVNQSDVESYRNKVNDYLAPGDEALVKRGTPAPTPIVPPTAAPGAGLPGNRGTVATTAPRTPAKPAADANNNSSTTAAPAKTDGKKTDAAQNDSKTADTPPDEVLTEPVFKGFKDGDSMEWPILGEIVMDYSMDHAIYDQTLDQYRTNSVLCIAAPVGTQVKATADGVVVSVTKDNENGNTVVIDNGNGWKTTYTQLQDGVLVGVGDMVQKGQVIGGVGSPSNFSVLLGNHLGLSVSRDDSYIDPKTLLKQ